MSEKDFAHIETAHFEQSDNASAKIALITIFALVFTMICFAVGFYMGEKHGLETNKGNKHEVLLSKLQKQKQELAILKLEAKAWHEQEASTSQIGELTFYNELPDQSIIPEPIGAQSKVKDNSAFLDKLEAELAKKKDHDEAVQGAEQKLEDIISEQLKKPMRSFRIQVASFKEKKDALSFIPKLNNIGIPAEVQRVLITNKGTFFRVYTQSYDKEQDAMQAKQLIKQKLHMTGIMVQNG